MSERSATIFVHNLHQDTGQVVPLADSLPSAEPLMLFAGGMRVLFDYPISTGESLVNESKQRHLFGAHVREAVAIVRDWIANG